jgi:hypothetical protein
MLEKFNVIFFQNIIHVPLYADCNSVILVSMGPCSCILERIWLAYADSSLLDVM